LDPQQKLLDAAARSLSAHWQYEPIKQCIPDIVCVDYLGAISSTAPGRQTDRAAIGNIELVSHHFQKNFYAHISSLYLAFPSQ
jgi:enhanced disease susceptibility 1 protein